MLVKIVWLLLYVSQEFVTIPLYVKYEDIMSY